MVSKNIVIISGVFKYKNCMFDEGRQTGIIMLYTSNGTIPLVIKKSIYRRIYGIVTANRNNALTARFIGTLKNYGTTQARKLAVEIEDFTLPLFSQDFKTNEIDMSERGEVVEDDEEATD